MTRFALGYTMNLNDIFKNFKNRKMDLSAKKCEEIVGNRHKEDITTKVFSYCVKLVLDDIIKDPSRFALPTGGREAYLYMKRVDGDDFVRGRQHGKWSDVDFLESDFSGYTLALKYKGKVFEREKIVYVDSARRNKITENTNNGKQYY